jgi:hypothetical protein
MLANKNKIKHLELFFFFFLFFCKEKLFMVVLTLRVTHAGSENESNQFDFLRNFHSFPTQQIFRVNALETWHPIDLYHSSNAKITSDVR